jgi:hypothetical protein
MSEYPCTYVRNRESGQIPFPPFITQQDMDVLANEFIVHDNDLFVVTYPRSGTTWTEQIVHLLLNQGEQGEQLLTDAAPWLETLPKRPGGMNEFLQSLAGQRLFTCHLPLTLMPGSTLTKGKYIYVARNPKDVAVSFYHHDRSKSGYAGSWDEYFTLFVEGKVMYGSYFEHVLPWWQASQKADNILFLKYEDMKRDLAAVVRQIANFIGMPLKQTLLERVMAGSNFGAMKTNKNTNFNWVPQQEGVPKHYRKGIIGDWRMQFSAEQNKLFDKVYRQEMFGSNLRFDFGDGLIL